MEMRQLQMGEPLHEVAEQFPAALRRSVEMLYCGPSQDS